MTYDCPKDYVGSFYMGYKVVLTPAVNLPRCVQLASAASVWHTFNLKSRLVAVLWRFLQPGLLARIDNVINASYFGLIPANTHTGVNSASLSSLQGLGL
jgi:hypothetical protein